MGLAFAAGSDLAVRALFMLILQAGAGAAAQN